MKAKSLNTIVSHCKEYGYIFQSSEIYDGLSAVYDYGSWGTELKKNIKDYWWVTMTRIHQNIVGVDAAILMHPKVWQASGHVDNFSDPLIDNKDSKKRYRVDHLIEAKAEEYKLQKKEKEAIALIENMNKMLAKENYEGLSQLIKELKIVCPVSGSSNWTKVRQFNLMFSVQSNINDKVDEETLYLRPETAQGIFTNFTNIQKTARMKVPFGIAQIGKAFRNEIVARQFTFRTKEFEQMEMQFFCTPGTEMDWFSYWKKQRMKWHLSIIKKPSAFQFHDHKQLAHYANAATDIEYQFPFGYKEIEGIHSRTDYDLKQHQATSGRKLHYFDPTTKTSYIPYVIETSIGLDRIVLAVLCESFCEEIIEKKDGKQERRTVLRIPSFLAPIKAAVLPLTKKDGLPEIAKDIIIPLKKDAYCFYEEKDSIGKRYRRMDALGTPLCITIDHQTKENHTVTVRNRDDMTQQRIKIDDIRQVILESTSIPTQSC